MLVYKCFSVWFIAYKLRGIAISISNLRSAAKVVGMVIKYISFLLAHIIIVTITRTFIFWVA